MKMWASISGARRRSLLGMLRLSMLGLRRLRLWLLSRLRGIRGRLVLGRTGRLRVSIYLFFRGRVELIIGSRRAGFWSLLVKILGQQQGPMFECVQCRLSSSSSSIYFYNTLLSHCVPTCATMQPDRLTRTYRRSGTPVQLFKSIESRSTSLSLFDYLYRLLRLP